MKQWDDEIAAIVSTAPKIFHAKPEATIGIFVDDLTKRDYFMPRIQKMMTAGQWTGMIRIVPMNGDPVVYLRARALGPKP